jgi:1-deoxy-D-xylulose-5-phosphate reductoisomerase|tara:strand:+ start:2779 stop:3942 length:1164 start_codon:yes stop_codon:yes gene_type:complete
MKKIAIFGSTGSIGTSLLNIIKKDKNKFKIELLTANSNYIKLIKQTKIFNVKNIIITDKKAFLITKKILKKSNINIYNNFSSFKKIFNDKKIDYTMSAISGFQGLKPTLDVIKFTRVIAIANKESIICGWCLIKKNLDKYKTEFIPIDSEHFSIWSLIGNLKANSCEKVYLTASGGPFRKYPLKLFKSVTPKKALNHPNWSMGKKISIDSATMMNKVFEIIEAKKIFNFKYKQLEILIHPQSYLHAIIKFNNGLTKLLIHDTNMTIPIFNSIYPKNDNKINTKSLDIKVLNNLNLAPIDKNRFPVVEIIEKLTDNDSLFETVIVSANDNLVNRFLNNEIKFTDISRILLEITNLNEFKKFKKIKPKNIEEVSKLANYVSLKVNTMSI